MPEVYIDAKRVRLDPSAVIGKGGEADIYRWGSNAVKLYKPPNHPDYQGMPHEQKEAKARIEAHQTKLPAFPKSGMPQGVVVPRQLARDKTDRIVGYAMPLVPDSEVLLRWTDQTFRQAMDPNSVVGVFKALHSTVAGVHGCGAVIGDFNDLNVLVQEPLWVPHLIDADSFQYGKWPCRVFTARFVDPMLCDPSANAPMLSRPHTENSDWYAYTVMLMQCLLFVDPYGGVYRPKDPSLRMPHSERPLRRVTVFDPEVKYPKPAVPYDRLPDDLLEYFHLTFKKDQRGEFPLKHLSNFRWTACANCGTLHARQTCPSCATTPTTVPTTTTTVRGNVTATRVYKTDGTIVCATVQSGKMAWLTHRNGEFRREDDTFVGVGDLDAHMRYRISGDRTLLAKNGRFVTFRTNRTDMLQYACDMYRDALPSVDANWKNWYWVTDDGDLCVNTTYTSRIIGHVLPHQTLFWVGPTFGLGFYRAGELSVGFVFDADGTAINDRAAVPRLRGHLVDATCFFDTHHAWLMTATEEGSRRVHRCAVLDRQGRLVGEAEAEEGDGSWLGTLRGKTAAGGFLLCPTDDGIKRVEAVPSVHVSREFPDTEPFVSSDTQLFAASDGVYAVGRHEVTRLQIR